jgi:hypothetical protein
VLFVELEINVPTKLVIYLHGQESVGIKVTLAGQISHQKFSQATVNRKIPFFPTQTAKKGSD